MSCSTPSFGEDTLKEESNFHHSGETVLEEDDELVVIEEGDYNHSLPSVEEVKINLGPNKTVSKKVAAMFLAVVAMIVIIVPVAILAKNDKIHHGASTATTEPESHVDKVFNFLVDNKVTSEPRLLDKKSPQHFAMQFMAAGDGFVDLDLLDDADYAQKFIERYSLVVMYYHLSGPHWTYKLKFLSPTDHCNWHDYYETAGGDVVKEGISCVNGSVTEIILAWNNLEGFDLPHELAHLVKLESFHAYSNKGLVSSEFPRVFRSMPQLKSLALQHASLSGNIPDWIGEMTALTSLALGDNSFEGTVSKNLKKLTNLRLLGLDDNKELHGNINELLGEMKNMEFLYLQGNYFDGSVDRLLEKMPNLMELDVSKNMLDGSFDRVLTHEKLMVADLHGNLLGSEFPSDFLENNNLEYLDVHDNEIRGPISDRIAFLKSLKHFDVSYNKLSGVIPDTVADMTGLVYFKTAGNDFSKQPIPDLRKLTELREWSMKGNNLVGSLPEWIGTMESLKLLDLGFNGLTGSIPASMGELEGINFLLLNKNKLSGDVNTLSTLTRLHALSLEGNDFGGNANGICTAHKESSTGFATLQMFTADCYPTPDGSGPEVTCSCCTKCCMDGDDECSNKSWETNYDPEWEYGYVRPSYHFTLDNAPVVYSQKNAEENPIDSIHDTIP
eukprot:CAMPEP_0178750624 /NCGR_PEP_ID=MMETSP0744-20121128/10098_1 /TAXON_ID=913974 /ORGANISM="Nitzschia punctata, Strain CCMP561" /LENGTH=669 /DNA_ID=CAMNT_0020404227 /DNA_START=219 /DNA_END=2228 /DNA_ORIENTATION=-